MVPASAEMHRVSVTLVTGQTLTLTVDVPPGSAVDSIALPDLPAAVESVVDLGPVATPTPTASPTETPTQTPEPSAAPTVPPSEATPTPTPAQAQTPAPDRPRRPDSVGDDRALRPNSEALSGRLEEKRDAGPDPTPPAGSPEPTVSIATPGPARIGVPNFFIDKFRIPPFLLPIYQAAGIEYGVRWEVLAAINEIETDYGRNLNVSSAGALGWMQFMPATWEMYGVDGNQDGLKDPYSPVDAIFAAARYLRAAGADTDLRAAIFAYNHADWYVDSVILRARYIGGLPADLVGSLSGLTQGRFPVQARAKYAQEVTRKDVREANAGENPAFVVESSSQRKGIRIFARAGAPVIAVNDGRIVRVGDSRRRGAFVVLQDVYGNTYSYTHLEDVVASFPAPRPRTPDTAPTALPPRRDAAPATPASVTTASEARARKASKSRTASAPHRATAAPVKERLFANPGRANATVAGGGSQDDLELLGSLGLDRSEIVMKPLERGARVTSGTVLGHVGRLSKRTPAHVRFEIRPAGRGAPRVDPKPILDGWKLLESTAIYRAAGRNPFVGKDAQAPSVGQILLMSKETLARRLLADPNVQIYGCGRRDVRAGQIDRRVLATLEFLAASGLKPTVTSLKCGHSYLTASGNVSEHSTGTAVDIAAINGVPILGHQGAGSIAELTIQRLRTLQGTMEPHQIISLMTFEDADNTFAMSDHADHIHVGFRPLYGANAKTAKQVDAILEPEQWIKLIDRLEEIDNPTVSRKPSRYAIDAGRRASRAHKGE
ncbi:MAG: lytic murein transglycosylase [Deltaproteobacteria bacterium]|nr:lytic murein transglycosylase [Deltaproteobacteria bacterium]